ncbi:MAG TPA: transcription antiterminator [Acetomicrobium flavidum]|nr:transcription antiterminator [Acetomicrobium flavidum]
MDMLRVKKVLNNNALIAEHPVYNEVVLLGKGIGFKKIAGDQITKAEVEKVFVLKNPEEQRQYVELVHQVGEEFVALMNEAIAYVESMLNAPLNEHIHVSLTDHLYFALKRIRDGVEIRNPFRLETELAYPLEYKVALKLAEWLQERLGLAIPEDEVGFIALHIHCALSNAHISNVTKRTQLITQLVNIVENAFKMPVDRNDINYFRFIRHLHFTIDRIESGKYADDVGFLNEALQKECPLSYTLAWKLMKCMQNILKKPVPEAEAVYLTLHLQRLYNAIQAVGCN